MALKSKRTFAVGVAVVGLTALVAVGVNFRRPLAEEWWLWCLCSDHEQEWTMAAGGNVNRKGKRVIGEKESTADVRWSTTIRSVSV